MSKIHAYKVANFDINYGNAFFLESEKEEGRKLFCWENIQLTFGCVGGYLSRQGSYALNSGMSHLSWDSRLQ